MSGGANTSAMELYNGTVYGQDNNTGNWYTWDGANFNGPVAAPPDPGTTPTPTPATVPSAPTITVGTTTANSIAISWTASTGTTPITYQPQYKDHSTTSWINWGQRGLGYIGNHNRPCRVHDLRLPGNRVELRRIDNIACADRRHGCSSTIRPQCANRARSGECNTDRLYVHLGGVHDGAPDQSRISHSINYIRRLPLRPPLRRQRRHLPRFGTPASARTTRGSLMDLTKTRILLRSDTKGAPEAV
jgi:hypothetical protein